MTLNKRERWLLVLTIAVVVGGLSWLLFVPLVRSYQALGDSLRNQQREYNGYQAAIARAPQWQADYDTLRQRLGQKVEQYAQMSDVLAKIGEVAKTYGLEDPSYKPLPETDRGVYRELPVKCNFNASTDSLVRFLYAMRSGSGFVNVAKLDVYTLPNTTLLRCEVVIQAIAAKTAGGST